MRPKVVTVLGTRPEAIKLVPVIKELERNAAKVESVVVATAQHRQMLDQVLSLFGIVPDYDLDIMRPEQDLFSLTSRALLGLRTVLEREKPDFLLTQGDTTTTLAAALAAFYLHIPIGHIEAGLRTYDKYRPFPEEANRRLVSTLADVHFAPTHAARDNLVREGVPLQRIHVTGNTAIDALLSVIHRPPSATSLGLLERLGFSSGTPTANGRLLILVTSHRRENWGQPIKDLCRAIVQIVAVYPEAQVAFSVHPNPQVQEIVRAELAGVQRVHLLEPLAYEPFVRLMQRAHILVTDSGGIQEEGTALGKPVLVWRDTTERPEGVKAGVLKIVGTQGESLLLAVSKLLSDAPPHAAIARMSDIYGDGHASQRIVRALLARWQLG